jgi:arylformamidase
MTPETESNTKWIDISVPLTDNMVSWPDDPPVRVERIEDLERGDRHSLSLLSMSSHSGTHVDAPAHFIKGGRTVDKIDFENLLGTVRVIEISDTESVKPESLKAFGIRKGERLLVKTGNSELWQNKKTFDMDFVYLTVETAIYLVERRVSLVGVDYLSVGSRGEDGSEVHRILLDAGVTIIEGLDLSDVGQGKYDLICLPLRIQSGDGAPARVIVRPR